MSKRDPLLAQARAGMTPTRRDRERRKARLLGSLGVAGTVSASSTALAATPSAASPAVVATLGMSLGAKALVVLGSAVLAIGASYGVASLTTDAGTSPIVVEERPTHSASREASELSLDPPMPTLREHRDGVPDDAVPDDAVADDAVADDAVADDAVADVAVADDAVADVAVADVAVADVAASRRAAPDLRARLGRAAPPDALAAEAALIDRSRRAIRDGDPDAALRALAEHARLHPSGMLAEEREVQRVRAYCALGDTPRAGRVAARFVREHPTSLHAVAMASPCSP